MSDKKKYDFSDFEAEETPAQSFDFSDFEETETPNTPDQKISKLDSAIAGGAQGATFGFADELAGAVGGVADYVTQGGKLDLKDYYKIRRDLARKEDEKKEEANPDTFLASNLAGGMATALVPVGGALRAGKGLKNAVGIGAVEGGLAGAGFSEADLTEGEVKEFAEDTAKGVGTGAVLSGVTQGVTKAAPKVWKESKNIATKLLPGTDDAAEWVNKTTAAVAAKNPFQSASKDDIFEMLANPEKRRLARSTNLVDKADELTESLRKVSDTLDDSVKNRFKLLEEASTKAADAGDLGTYKILRKQMADELKKVRQNPDFYSGEAKGILRKTSKALNKGGPEEFGTAAAGKTIRQLAKEAGEEGSDDVSQLIKKRVLNARRNLDDATKNRDFSTMAKHDREVIMGTRDNLKDSLQSKFSGSDERQAADKLYSQYKQASDDLLGPVTSKSGSGKKEFDLNKVDSLIRSKTGRGQMFDKRIAKMEDFLKQAEPKLGKIPEVSDALKVIKDARELTDMQGLLGGMERAGGGPTSQAVNLLAQGAGAQATGGLSLLLLPITNPVAWTKVVDQIGAPIADSITKAAKAIAEKDPSFAVRAMILAKENEDQE